LLILFSPFSRSLEKAVPPHFYGEMSKTDLGCQVLQQKGHFAEFTQFIRKHGMESEDPDLIMKLKSVLWAIVRIAEPFTESH
jgi:rapamycin-insensitive companion of mTOR